MRTTGPRERWPSGRLLALAFLTAAMVAACATKESEAERTFTDVYWDLRWVVAATDTSDLLLRPTELLTDGERVYVADAGAVAIQAFDLESGEFLWSFGSEGDGPGEFRRIDGLSATPGGDLAVLDSRNRRITIVNTRGELEGQVRLPDGTPQVSAICSLQEGFLARVVTPGEPLLIVIDRHGRLDSVPGSFPWRVDDTVLSNRTAFLGGEPGGVCAYGLALGPGFVIYRDGSASAHRYVEPVDFPEVTRTGESVGMVEVLASPTEGARGIVVQGEEVGILFGGVTEDRHRIIDYYSSRDGSYLYSVRGLPNLLRKGVAAHGDRFVLLHEEGGYPRLSMAVRR